MVVCYRERLAELLVKVLLFFLILVLARCSSTIIEGGTLHVKRTRFSLGDGLVASHGLAAINSATVLPYSVIRFIELSAHWLVLPMALWLGYRYGQMGLAAVELGGLGLPLRLSYKYFTLPGYPDVYLSALFLVWLASRLCNF